MKIYSTWLILLSQVFLFSCADTSKDPVEFDLSDRKFPKVIIHSFHNLKDEVSVSLFLVDQDSIQRNVILKPVVSGTEVTFSPIYPLTLQNTYKMEVRWGDEKETRMIPPDTSVEKKPISVTVYPKSNKLPRNILQFHVVFSEPMVTDVQTYERIMIMDSEGNMLPHMWREKSEWGAQGRHLELMAHPGRVKQGITYLGDDQPLLQPGKEYSLVVMGDLPSRSGSTFSPQIIKTFVVMPDDHDLPKIERHGIDSSGNGFITFSEPMDYGTMRYGLQKETGERMDIGLRSGDDITWYWDNGSDYRTITLGTIISDLAANRISRRFEVTNPDSIRLEKGQTLILK